MDNLNLMGWGIVSNNKGIYNKTIYPNHDTIRVLNTIFEYNTDISKYRLKFITWNQERERKGFLYYSISGTGNTWVPTLGTNFIYTGRIVGKPLSTYDLDIFVIVNDTKWNFEIGFADIPLKKRCSVEIINPTYSYLIKELGKAIDKFISE